MSPSPGKSVNWQWSLVANFLKTSRKKRSAKKKKKKRKLENKIDQIQALTIK